MYAPTKMLSALFLSSIAVGPSAVNAVDIYTRYFAGVSGGKPCYARYYGPAHLNAHPKQTVRRIEVGFDQGRRDDKATKNTPTDFQASRLLVEKETTPRRSRGGGRSLRRLPPSRRADCKGRHPARLVCGLSAGGGVWCELVSEFLES